MFCFTSRVWKDFNIMLISWNWLNKTVRENCYFWESKSHLCWWKTRHMAYMLGMHWQARCCGCCMRFLGENKLVSHGQVTFWMLHPSCNKKLTKTVAKKKLHFYVASYSKLSADWTCVKLKCILWPLYEQCIYGCRWPHHAVVSEWDLPSWHSTAVDWEWDWLKQSGLCAWNYFEKYIYWN